MLAALSHVLVVWAVVFLFSASRVFLVLVFMNLEQLGESCFSNGQVYVATILIYLVFWISHPWVCMSVLKGNIFLFIYFLEKYRKIIDDSGLCILQKTEEMSISFENFHAIKC